MSDEYNQLSIFFKRVFDKKLPNKEALPFLLQFPVKLPVPELNKLTIDKSHVIEISDIELLCKAFQIINHHHFFDNFILESKGEQIFTVIPMMKSNAMLIDIDAVKSFKKEKDLELNGLDVFSFSIKEPPQNIKNILERTSTPIESIDYFVFHQANKFIMELLRKKLRIDEANYILGLRLNIWVSIIVFTAAAIYLYRSNRRGNTSDKPAAS